MDKKASPSGELAYTVDGANRMIHCEFGDLTRASTAEFVDFVAEIGDAMARESIGRLSVDISQMKGFDIIKRMAVIKNVNAVLFSKMPFLVLAVIKGKSLFENTTMQLAIAAAKPLSKKFLGSESFDSSTEAIKWLKGFKVTL